MCFVLFLLLFVIFPLPGNEFVVKAIICRQIRPGMRETELRERWGEPKRTWKQAPAKSSPWWIGPEFTVTGSALLYTRIYFMGNVLVVYVSPKGVVERVDIKSSS